MRSFWRNIELPLGIIVVVVICCGGFIAITETDESRDRAYQTQFEQAVRSYGWEPAQVKRVYDDLEGKVRFGECNLVVTAPRQNPRDVTLWLPGKVEVTRRLSETPPIFLMDHRDKYNLGSCI
jgi:hypothetical protein